MDVRNPELAVGDRVTYTVGRHHAELEAESRSGSVAAAPVYDRYTTTWWVPVHPDGAADDTEPKWVRGDHIVEDAAH